MLPKGGVVPDGGAKKRTRRVSRVYYLFIFAGFAARHTQAVAFIVRLFTQRRIGVEVAGRFQRGNGLQQFSFRGRCVCAFVCKAVLLHEQRVEATQT